MKQSLLRTLTITLLACCTAHNQAKPITTTAEYELLRSKIENHLKELTQARINMMKSQEEGFSLPENFGDKQRSAQHNFEQSTLPRITKEVPLQAKEGSENSGMALMIDVNKIQKLSPQQLSKVLEACSNLMGLFPPLPDQAKEWSQVITPLLTFDKADRSALAKLIGSWLDRLLEQDDLEELASLSSLSKQEQKKQLKELRKSYADLASNASQLLYTWVQLSTILNKDNPLRAFLRHATTTPNALEKKFTKLREKLHDILTEQKGKKVTDEDVDGLILLSIASLFAPEGVSTLLRQTASKGESK